jgi:hypothetical protein
MPFYRRDIERLSLRVKTLDLLDCFDGQGTGCHSRFDPNGKSFRWRQVNTKSVTFWLRNEQPERRMLSCLTEKRPTFKTRKTVIPAGRRLRAGGVDCQECRRFSGFRKLNIAMLGAASH